MGNDALIAMEGVVVAIVQATIEIGEAEEADRMIGRFVAIVAKHYRPGRARTGARKSLPRVTQSSAVRSAGRSVQLWEAQSARLSGRSLVLRQRQATKRNSDSLTIAFEYAVAKMFKP
jgi:hypothetical protein